MLEKKNLVWLIEQKKAGEVDIDWQEICAQYDLDMNVETLRKAGVGIKLASDACLLNDTDVQNAV